MVLESTAPPQPRDHIIPEGVAVDLLTAAELDMVLRPMRRDYCRIVAGTSHLPNKERGQIIRQRLEVYSNALGKVLGDAMDDATILVRGVRGGRR